MMNVLKHTSGVKPATVPCGSWSARSVVCSGLAWKRSKPSIAHNARHILAQPSKLRQITCQGLYDPLGDVPVTVDTLGTSAPAVKNLSFASFWLQLPLTIVSAGILFFAVQFTRTPADVSRWFTLVGIVCAFISTFFAHGFLTLARRAANEGKVVRKSAFVQNLVRNTTLNLLGIGITIFGLQASVGTLVSKTMLAAANAPYASPQPGSTLVSLDVFSLQASTNTLLAHFLSICFSNVMLSWVNKATATTTATTGC
eukprot:jgi/Chrzof1/5681/Cz16g11150.t1_TIC21B[v5.2]